MQPLLDHFNWMAAYNRVANSRIYAAVGQLPRAEFVKPRQAFFGSIQGALNHIVVGDTIWLDRFDYKTATLTELDAILYDDFEDLARARRDLDARIDRFVDGLTAEFLAGRFSYRSVAGDPANDPVPLLLAHFFNHQTHHRGQVHDMLSQTDVPPPSLDLHRCFDG